MPHMPGVGHRPPEGQVGISALFEAPLAWAEKVESSCCRCCWPQDGQTRVSVSPERRISFSNLVRNIAETKGAEIVTVSDLRPERLALAKKRYPAITVTTDNRELVHDPTVDVVVISTPVHTHFRLAMEALQMGKHVVIEKPITASSEEALRLIEAAAARNLQIMVDHTFVYSGPVRKIKELIASGSLGKLYYYDSVRINLGLFQPDVSVIWDLAVHDLAIMDYVLGKQPVAVSATGLSHVEGRPENIAYITMLFEEPVIAHLHVNWLSPVKVRRTLIGGSEKMVVYDDTEATEKVKIYDRSEEHTSELQSLRHL